MWRPAGGRSVEPREGMVLAALVSGAVVVLQIAIVLAALFVLPRGRRPQTAMAWVILIVVLPFLGLVLFLLFGRTSVGRSRRRGQEEVNRAIVGAVARQSPTGDPGRPLDDVDRGFTVLNQNLSGLPMTYGNRLELHPDYRETIQAMADAVASASRYVHVEFYIAAWDDVTAPFFEELVRATERGVEVRLLFDHLGSRGIPVHKEFLRRLEGTRIRWAAMLPVRPLHGELRRPDLRNHRKILVVDGRLAFSGSQNLIEPCYDKPGNQRLGREWIELVARIEGPAVHSLDVVFATDWLTETGENLAELVAPRTEAEAPAVPVERGEDVGIQVIPSGPGFVTENNLRLFTSMLYSAHRRLSITSPYFVPDDSLLYAVTTAAQRGVEVELFVSATADQFMVAHAQRSYYEALLVAGVRIWLYPEPFVLHAKHFSVDDRIAVVGSSNMDMRSFALNYEVVMMITGAGPLRALAQVQDTYRGLSTELTLEAWRRRPWRSVGVDNLMRLTATLQ